MTECERNYWAVLPDLTLMLESLRIESGGEAARKSSKNAWLPTTLPEATHSFSQVIQIRMR